jgi:hypothetical protein
MTWLALVACSIAVLAFGGAFAFMGVALATGLAPQARTSEALLDASVLALVLALTAIETLGFKGMLTPAALALMCACGCGVAWRANGPAALRALRGHLRAARAAVRGSPSLWALLPAAVLLACRALARVPTSWDALGYHLTFVAHWIRHHGFEPFGAGGAWEQYESFPKAGEALFWLAMAPFHSDAVVGLVNLPFWFGIALAFRCAAVRLGASARAASIWSAPLLLHPMLSAYVTPTYVELQIVFYLLAAVAFALRALEDVRAATLLGLTACLAAATKVTALSWFVPLALFGVVLARRHGARRLVRALRRAPSLLGLAVALAWYVYNAGVCDNPLYPAPLPFAASGPAAGSLAMARSLNSSSIARIGNYDELGALLLEPPWRVRYPLGPGALLPWLWLALPLLLPFVREPARRGRALGIWALAWFLLLVYLWSPHNGEFLDANTRFLALPCVLAGLALAAVHDCAAPLPRRLALLGTWAIALLAVWPTQLWRLPEWAPLRAHPAVWLTAVLLLALCAALLWPGTWARRGAALAVVLCACVLAACAALRERERDRAADLAAAIDLHPVLNETGLYPDVLRLGAARIAFAVGGYNGFEGWFFYPLFGARLEHDVEYVDIEREAAPACRRRGLVRDAPDEQAWLSRIEARRITHLFTSGAPLEARWAHVHPERFVPLAARGTSELFRVTPAP